MANSLFTRRLEEMTSERRKEIEGRAIRTYGEQPQVDMCIEEMSELTKELLKLRRESTQAGFQKRRENIKEEISDVQIMLDQMRIIFGDTAEQEEFKLKRLNDRLESCLTLQERYVAAKYPPLPYKEDK
jgi:NTP pyrophosphatase (non-canonical NTP hydrolase)